MSVGGQFRGISSDRDTRFEDKTKKLLTTTKFPSLYREGIDMTSIDLDSIKPWIRKRIEELILIEDEVLNEYVISMLEDEEKPDPKLLHISLVPFLETKTVIFMKELWNMLISAQNSITGIPASLEKSKEDEIEKENLEKERISRKLREKKDLVERERMKGSDKSERYGESRDLNREKGNKQEWSSESEGEAAQTRGRSSHDRHRSRDRDSSLDRHHRSKHRYHRSHRDRNHDKRRRRTREEYESSRKKRKRRDSSFSS